jgi:K+-sensing histidine kinase KdpD
MTSTPRAAPENEGIALASGALGALFLGIALSPLRGLTPAANFTFAFMALTITVAEWGGRKPAVVTALVSALSLDFFLTKPYLTLSIAHKDDVIAFVGLAACGLIAAAFGSRRERRATAHRQLDFLHVALRRLERAGHAEAAIAETLDAARAALPVSAMMVRDAQGRVLVGTASAAGRPSPVRTFAPESLSQDAALPADGGRLALVAGNRTLGFLDVWGTGEPMSHEERRTLTALARVLAASLALDELSTLRGSTLTPA